MRPASALLLFATLPLAACNVSMARQPRPGPERSAELWPGGPAVSPPPQGVVAFGQPQAPAGPPPMTLALLQRGRDRFAIFCSPCHGARGHADGAVVRRGFPAPPSYDEPRLTAAPISHFHDVARDGYGVMYGFGDRMPDADLWAVAAYVRVLQLADRASPPAKGGAS